MVVTWNLGFGWISGRAPPALLPPHDESQCTANCPSERDSGLLFSFILLHAGHVRHRVLIDHRVGLLNLVVVGQGDKRKVWPVPLHHLSLLSWLSRAAWWQGWTRQAEVIQRGHRPWMWPLRMDGLLASLCGYWVSSWLPTLDHQYKS